MGWASRAPVQLDAPSWTRPGEPLPTPSPPLLALFGGGAGSGKGLPCSSGGFHGETAEDEKEELKTQKEEEREKLEMSRDQEEVTEYMETHTEMGVGTAWGWRLLALVSCVF